MVGFSKPDTFYLLCSLVALSLSKLHFLEKQRLEGGSHLPLSFSPRNRSGLPSYYFWGSGSRGSLENILLKPSSSHNLSSLQPWLWSCCKGGALPLLLRLIGDCLLPAFWVHSFLLHEKRWRNRSALNGLQFTQGLKTAGKVALLPTYSSAREAFPALGDMPLGPCLLSLSSALPPPSLSLTSDFLSLENEAMNHMSSLGFHLPAQSIEKPLFCLQYSQLSIIQVWTFHSVGGLWMIPNTRPPLISQHTFLQVLIGVCSEPRIEFGRKSCCQSTVHSRALHELFCVIHIMEYCPLALSWRP